MVRRGFSTCFIFVALTVAGVTQAQTYTLVDEIFASDAAFSDNFGTSVDVSGNIAVVGAPDARTTGAVYVFNADTGAELFSLTPPDGSGVGQDFGRAVAIDGSIIVVGSPQDNDNDPFSGSAYVFNADDGSFIVKLLPDDGAGSTAFGYRVDVSGGLAIIGTPGDDAVAGNAGAAYVFDVLTGMQRHKLTASDPAPGDSFGFSVGISGNVAIVGAPFDDNAVGGSTGAAYVFEADSGVLQFKYIPSVAVPSEGFAKSVAVDGSFAIVSSGFRASWVIDAGSGAELGTIEPDTGATVFFGNRDNTSISGNFAIVGDDNDGGAANGGGAAFVFDLTTFTQVQRLEANDAMAFDGYGTSVGISNNRIVIGAEGDDGADFAAGSAYLYMSDAPVPCSGDCDGSGDVSFGDLVAMLAEFGTAGTNPGCDADGSGTVSFGDLVATLGLFGPCPE